MDPHLDERCGMVATSIEARGITDPEVLRAMRAVPRHAFVPEDLVELAYQDSPLPIGEGQTISQPYIVAMMTEALRLSSSDRVLEVGTGSGYGAAVLGRIAGEVYSIERHEALATQAARTLAATGFTNVHVVHGDGTLGLPAHAPYDAISVTAGGPVIPRALLAQLVEGGRLVMPVGPSGAQTLLRVTRLPNGRFETEDLGPVRFVPLIGESDAEDSEVRPL